MAKEEVIGHKYGQLTVLQEKESKGFNRIVTVMCDCGKVKDVFLANIKYKRVKSCGCLRYDIKDDLKGSKYGEWTILYDEGIKTKRKGRIVKARCECGVVKSIKLSSLKNGSSKSCGCLKICKTKERLTKHSLFNTRIYGIHQHMKSRCLNKNNDSYKNYGGRGIDICDEWLGERGFMNFYNWAMANGYSEKLSIDRIDNDKGYSPENCRWADALMQVTNRRLGKNNKTGYIGISLNKKNNMWESVIFSNYKCIRIGSFEKIEDAIESRNNYIRDKKLLNKIQYYKK